MPTAHCVSTTDGIILAVDRGFVDLMRRPETALVGSSYRDITHPTDLARSARMLDGLVDRAAPLRFDKRYLRPNGSSVAAHLLVSRFTAPDRLVSTLFWQEAAGTVSPARLWQAALRIRHVLDVRRAQFGAELASDPVGTLLVSIYLAEAEGRAIDLAAAAEEADLTPATALRWVRALRQQGVVQAGGDESLDIRLSQAGIIKMERTLAAVYDPPEAMPPLT